MTSLQPVWNKGPQCLQQDQISHTSFYSTKLLQPHHLLVQTCLCQKLCSRSLESLSSIFTILPASFDNFISDRHITEKGHESKKDRQIFPAVQQHRCFENLIPQTGKSKERKSEEVTKLCCSQYTGVAGTGMTRFWDALRLHTPQFSWCEHM